MTNKEVMQMALDALEILQAWPETSDRRTTMNKIITSEEMVRGVMECLNAAVGDYLEEEREEAKARILETWQLSMFYAKTTGEQQ